MLFSVQGQGLWGGGVSPLKQSVRMAGLDLLGMLAVQGGEELQIVARLVAMIEKLAPHRSQQWKLCPAIQSAAPGLPVEE